MQRVYVAGPYTAPNGIALLKNIQRGRRKAAEILLKGAAVYCPWLDSELFLQLKEEEHISEEFIKEHSMKWLEVSDFVYVLKGWQNSKGTRAEIARAEQLGIPVVFEIEEDKK